MQCVDHEEQIQIDFHSAIVCTEPHIEIRLCSETRESDVQEYEYHMQLYYSYRRSCLHG